MFQKNQQAQSPMREMSKSKPVCLREVDLSRKQWQPKYWEMPQNLDVTSLPKGLTKKKGLGQLRIMGLKLKIKFCF